MNHQNFIRKIASDTKGKYNLELNSYICISNKCFKCKCKSGQEYLIKKSTNYIQEKYRFLHNQGVDNVLYPLENNENQLVTKADNDGYYIMPFISNFYVLDEVKATSLITELTKLHNNTAFKRKLSVSLSKKKIEEIIEYLNYKFTLVEAFVRTLEAQSFDEFSIPMLKNYQYILDGKKVLIRLNKKIIYTVKESKTVTYCFLHNNPKLEHLLTYSGKHYLISLEKGKIGIPSLDIAKFYLENSDLKIDIASLIDNYFKNYDDDFYFDYFCFLVLLFYIKGLIVDEKDYVTSQSFIFTAKEMKKFIEMFDLNNRK